MQIGLRNPLVNVCYFYRIAVAGVPQGAASGPTLLLYVPVITRQTMPHVGRPVPINSGARERNSNESNKQKDLLRLRLAEGLWLQRPPQKQKWWRPAFGFGVTNTNIP